MPNYLDILFRRRNGQVGDGHPDPEDLACLAQGCLEEEKRGPVVDHVLNCDRCYRVVEGTLAELELDRAAAGRGKRIFRRPSLAVAASILTAMVGVGVYYNLPQNKFGNAPVPVARQMMRGEKPQDQAKEKKAAAPAPKVLEEQKPAEEVPALERTQEQEAPLAQALPAPGAAVATQPPPPGGPRQETAKAAPESKGPTLGLTRVGPKVKAPAAPPARITMHLRLDAELLALLRENRNQVWTDPAAVRRLKEIIRKRLGREVDMAKVSWDGEFPERLNGKIPPKSLIIVLNKGQALLRPGDD